MFSLHGYTEMQGQQNIKFPKISLSFQIIKVQLSDQTAGIVSTIITELPSLFLLPHSDKYKKKKINE